MNAILIGCGSKFGLSVLKQMLKDGHTVYSLSGTDIDIKSDNLHHKTVSWNTLSPIDLEKFLANIGNVDLIFFNQNGSSLSSYDFSPLREQASANTWGIASDWAQSHFVSCILPYYIIKRLEDRITPNTKIAWMLSHLVINHHLSKAMGHADYIGNKFQNYMVMKNFSVQHNGCFFGIDPGSLESDPYNIEEFLHNVFASSRKDLNGTVRLMDFSINTEFNKLQGGDMLSFSANRKLNEITTSEYAKVKLVFNVGVTNGSSMTLAIGDCIYTDLQEGKFETEVLVEFPSKLKFVVDGKSPNDTIVEDGKIVADKFIQLEEIYVNDVKINSDYLNKCIELHTLRNSVVTSNYWGFNGYAYLDFNSKSAFDWIVSTKRI